MLSGNGCDLTYCKTRLSPFILVRTHSSSNNFLSFNGGSQVSSKQQSCNNTKNRRMCVQCLSSAVISPNMGWGWGGCWIIGQGAWLHSPWPSRFLGRQKCFNEQKAIQIPACEFSSFCCQVFFFFLRTVNLLTSDRLDKLLGKSVVRTEHCSSQEGSSFEEGPGTDSDVLCSAFAGTHGSGAVWPWAGHLTSLGF